MFGNLGQMMNLLKNAGALKQSMQEMQQRVQAARFTGEAGGGQVKVTVDGRGDIQGVKIDPQLVQSGDVEMLEDLVCAAVRDATQRSREALQKEMQELTGGMGLPGMDLDQLMGGGGGTP